MGSSGRREGSQKGVRRGGRQCGDKIGVEEMSECDKKEGKKMGA